MKKTDSYARACAEWTWDIPERFNMGVSVCDVQNQSATALIVPQQDGGQRDYSFGDLKKLSSRLSNLLLAHGLERGDRVAVLLPQMPETLVAHIAAYRAGFIAMPLAQLFGPDALEYRLSDSGARVLITDRASCTKISEIRDALPDLELVLSVDGPADDGAGGARDFHGELERAKDSFAAVDTDNNDPALLIYTSGTTGNPKGALLPHRTMLGHLPGVDFIFDFLPQPGDILWTPADWAWIGALMDSAMPALYHGIPQVVNPLGRFDPEASFDLIARYGVRNAFVPPTALKVMRQVEKPRERWDYNLRSMFSGGEALGTSLMDWGRENLGVTINEAYGQTECNVIVGCCAPIMTPPDGSMGRASPGHNLKILDEDGNRVPAGGLGTICVKAPDPVMFLEYWKNPQATEEKFITDANGDRWLDTGDKATMDEDDWIFFVGRADDVINSAGYRIGPAEVENSLLSHPAIASSAVIGIPDEARGELVKAFIILKDGETPSSELAAEIQNYVKKRLAGHEFPRALEFVAELPMTATGKIQRKVLRERDAAKVAAS
ncbi:MAG: AMP-binding protein [Alphaproteobacteria bacterium]|nr:AMP-binding protein [Alphaproteobacteria bacterium]